MTKQRVTLYIVLAAVIVVGSVKLISVFSQKGIDSVSARTKGHPNATVKIVEFIDFQCPACAYGSKLLGQYIVKYPQDVQVQMKYFPLAKHHAHAMRSALYSECAGRQNKFWQFHELLMAQQAQWSGVINADSHFLNIARQAGIDLAQLNVCLGSDEVAKTINDDRVLGQSLGVQSTPTYFVNNKMVVGAKSLTDELNTYFSPEK